jgi:hypothetical protein
VREQRIVENFIIFRRQLCTQMKVRVEQVIAGWTLPRIVLVTIPQNLLGTTMVQYVSARQSLQRVVLQAIGLATKAAVQTQRVLGLSRQLNMILIILFVAKRSINLRQA